MNRGMNKLSKQTEEYLNNQGIPYIKLDGTINLILLKNNSTYHYCAVEFFEVDDEWYKKKKPFKFKRIWGNTMDTITNRINKYLGE
jgi:hypothetical protein